MDTPIVPPMKRCTKCGIEKLATAEYFIKRSSAKDGLYSWCRECNKNACNGYYETHREERCNYEKYRRDLFAEVISSQRKRRYRVDIEKSRANRRKWYNQAKEGFTDEQKRKKADDGRNWRRNNPDKARAIKHKRRARELEAEGFFTAQDIEIAYRSQRGRCWHCFTKVGGKYHADHLISLKNGGTNWPNNIVISCASCNISKGSKSTQEWNGRLF